MKTTNPYYRKAFTLIELLIVILIICLLAGLLLPALNSARKQAKKTQTSSSMMIVKQACSAYYNEYGELPPVTQLEGVDPETILTAEQVGELINLLDGTDSARNQRKINFLRSLRNKEIQTVGGHKAILDAWGKPVRIYLDRDNSATIFVDTPHPDGTYENPNTGLKHRLGPVNAMNAALFSTTGVDYTETDPTKLYVRENFAEWVKTFDVK